MNEVLKSGLCFERINGNRVLFQVIVMKNSTVHECGHLSKKGKCDISRQDCLPNKGKFGRVKILP